MCHSVPTWPTVPASSGQLSICLRRSAPECQSPLDAKDYIELSPYRADSFRSFAVVLANSAAFSKFKRTPMPVPFVNSMPRRSNAAVIFSTVAGYGSLRFVSKLLIVWSETPAAKASSGCVRPRSSLADAICLPEIFILVVDSGLDSGIRNYRCLPKSSERLVERLKPADHPMRRP
mgnify:CR=1 FL=1